MGDGTSQYEHLRQQIAESNEAFRRGARDAALYGTGAVLVTNTTATHVAWSVIHDPAKWGWTPPADGRHRRFFWRVRHRVGPGWDKLSEREIRKLLRQWSWRRAH